MKKVAIIGVGPAGLLAAWACSLTGTAFELFGMGAYGKATKSPMGGSQFLHRSVPDLCDHREPDAMIRLHVAGSWSDYRQKVYGVDEVPFASIAKASDGADMPAWSLVRAYDFLWKELTNDGEWVHVGGLDAEKLDTLVTDRSFDMVVSTIPRPAVCYQNHTFSSQSVRVTEETILPEDVDNTILYDATGNVPWYRTSKIFGASSTEYGFSHDHVELSQPFVTRRKPMFTDCDCFNGQVLFSGRYGAWDKKILSHDAFEQTFMELDN